MFFSLLSYLQPIPRLKLLKGKKAAELKKYINVYITCVDGSKSRCTRKSWTNIQEKEVLLFPDSLLQEVEQGHVKRES